MSLTAACQDKRTVPFRPPLSVPHRLINQYAKGYEKTPFGDYAKNKQDIILALNKTPLFQFYTNISVHDRENDVTLLIWVPLFGGKKSYGIIIQDEEKQESYQIKVDEHLETSGKDDQKLLEEHQPAIMGMKEVVKSEWDIDL